MTNREKIGELFPYLTIVGTVFMTKHTEQVLATNVNYNWLDAEYKEPIIEHEQKINKSAMMHEIYMEGVNMSGEYQGCWVRFKEIEKIVDKYVR